MFTTTTIDLAAISAKVNADMEECCRHYIKTKWKDAEKYPPSKWGQYLVWRRISGLPNEMAVASYYPPENGKSADYWHAWQVLGHPIGGDVLYWTELPDPPAV